MEAQRTYISCKKTLAIFLFSILFLLQFPAASAQRPARIDSLLESITRPFESDSLKVSALQRISFYYTNDVEGDTALIYLDQIKDISESGNYRYGMVIYEFWLGYYHFRRARYDEAIHHILRSSEYARSLRRPKQEAECYSRAALIFDIRGETDSARHYLKKGITISSHFDDLNIVALSYNTLGNLEMRAGNHVEALHHFIAVDSICRASEKNMAYRQGIALHNIANLYLDVIKDNDQALEYMLKAREAYERKADNAEQLDASDYTFGKIYLELGDLSKADSLLQSAVNGYLNRGHMRKVAEISMTYGLVKEQLNQIAEAGLLYEQAEKIYLESNDMAGSVNISSRLARFYSDLGDYDQSISYYKRALEYNIGDIQRSEILRKLAGTYRMAGSATVAYDTLMSYVELSDSVNIQKLSADLQEMEARYQSSLKEKEIVDLKLKQSQQSARNQQFIYGGIALLSLLSGFSFMFYYRAKQRTQTNEKLKELDHLKSRLFADISHELRTPISLIRGPVEVLLKAKNISGDVRDQLSMVKRNADRLNHLASSVNDLTQLEDGKLNLSIRNADLLSHLKFLVASFESTAISRGLRLIANLDQSCASISFYDPNCIETIVTNLLSNAFKFTREGQVLVEASIKNQWAHITVSDTGIGISEKNAEKVFDRYFKIEKDGNNPEGIGIGLALSHSLTRLHKGELSVISKENEGSTFGLKFPVDKSFYQGLEIIEDEFFEPQIEKPSLVHPEGPDQTMSVIVDESSILIVEDNVDMRKYLDRLFDSEYRIVSAPDGQKGIEAARKYIPDIIISDLMMPVMNGHEFLSEVKRDHKTSHIPFIMLTANHNEVEKLKGLKTGADDFITKPFSQEELRTRVENLIRSREMIREKYLESSFINPDLLSKNDADKQFWRNIQSVLKSHLGNSNFTINDFAQAMYMSRMQLHRKLKALTNLSASAFLRNQRLKTARNLLRTSQLSVSEIAYEVGFSSPFYFSTCFKEVYGVTPKAFAQSEV